MIKLEIFFVVVKLDAQQGIAVCICYLVKLMRKDGRPTEKYSNFRAASRKNFNITK